MAQTKRQQLTTLVASLTQERQSHLAHWRDIADYMMPRRPQWLLTDTNRGERRNQKIVDETGALAARVLSAGMMAGMTSPAREWFRLTTHDPDLAEYGPVKDWLHLVDSRMTSIFSRSNLYTAFPQLYGDAGVFGTSPMLVEEDFDKTMRTFVFPIGSYLLALDDRLKVAVFAREFRLTVRQLVMKFGMTTRSGAPDWSKFSQTVKSAYDNGNYDQWVDCQHVIQPNADYRERSLTSKPFASCYWEKGNQGNQDVFLRESGYDRFPVLAARWEVTGEDVYGTNCPGMMALGSVKQVQTGEKRIMQAVEKMVNPPLVGPTALRQQKVTMLPGDVNYLDEREGQKGLRPLHEVVFRVQEMEEKQRQKRDIINECFFKNLFLMFTNMGKTGITATEINARQEEKLILGSVLEQLNQDVYDPLIDLTFDYMVRQGQVPPPPRELQGQALKVEYVSILHQSMKVAGLSSIDRLTSYVGGLAGLHPDVVDKFDLDQAVDEYAEILGTPPRIVRPDDQVEEIRAQRAQQQQAAAQMAAMQTGAKTAKDLSGADMSGDNALTRMTQQSKAGALVPA